ncbi:MAG: xylulokinase [Pseudomonadota bacterium]
MYLGIDLGTSGVKALLIGEGQDILSSASAPLEVSRPHDGWSEQDPASWISATEAVIAELGASHDLNAVKGIGLSGQMHGATLIDEADQVLRPCMLWNDTRSHVEAAALDENPIFRSETGNIVFPGFTAPKVDWVKNNEPAIFAKTKRILLPKDYLRLWLTGEHVSEMSDAAGTSWLNTGERDWSDALLGACDLDRSHMPRLVEGSENSGGLRSELASKFGMTAGIAVAGGGGDNAASAVGAGVVTAGQAFLSLGTSGVVFAANEGYAPDPDSALHTFCHAFPETWHQMGVILAAADALSWYGNLVGAEPATLTDELGPAQAPGRTMFLPYLGGERTPHNDAKVRGAFIGLEHSTQRATGTLAVLEGVAFALADSVIAMRETGTDLDMVLALGGGSKSQAWLQIVSNTLNISVAVPEDGDFGAAFGAARLGMMAAGQATPSDATPPKIAKIIEPDPALVPAFADAHTRYSSTYQALKELS